MKTYVTVSAKITTTGVTDRNGNAHERKNFGFKSVADGYGYIIINYVIFVCGG